MKEDMSGSIPISDVAELVLALRKQADEAETLKSKPYDSPDFHGWLARCKSLVRKANEPDFLQQLEFLRFRPTSYPGSESPKKREARIQEHHVRGLQAAQGILRQLAEHLETFGIPILATEDAAEVAPAVNITLINRNVNQLVAATTFQSILNEIKKMDLATEEAQVAQQQIRRLETELVKKNPSWETIKRIVAWAIDFGKELFFKLLPYILERMQDIR